MICSQTMRRVLHWADRFSRVGPDAKRSGRPARRRAPRPLRVESLEQRALLSVTTIGNTWKDVAFQGAGSVHGSVNSFGVHITYSGPVSIHGTIRYTSATDGALIPDPDPTNSVFASGGSGESRSDKWTATVSRRVVAHGKWTVEGHAENFTDTNGQLAFDGIPDTLTVTPSQYDPGIQGGTYSLTGTFNTKNFKIHADFPTGQFNGTVHDTNKDKYDVIAVPSWDATIPTQLDVSVSVPGPVRKTPLRTKPTTNIQAYWAKGTTFAKHMGKALDTIPVYWNEAGGDYTISDLPATPTGATHVLLVTKVGKKREVVALALPAAATASEAAARDAAIAQLALPGRIGLDFGQQGRSDDKKDAADTSLILAPV
jgi:hypothetical protein